MTDDKKLPRQGPPANYRTKVGDNCGDCIYMNDDGSCEVVEGIVDREHVCDFYKLNLDLYEE